MNKLFIILAIFSIMSCKEMVKGPEQAKSPGAQVEVQFDLTEAGQPYYWVIYNGDEVIAPSMLGLDLNHSDDLVDGFRILSVDKSTFDETWEQPWGEEQFIRNNYSSMIVHLEEKSDPQRLVDIEFRVYDYGIGFRYVFPQQENLRNFEVLDELTEFNLTGDHTAWSIPAFEPNRYEYLYRTTPVSRMGKVHTPVTFRTERNVFMSIHEAALRDYSSMVIDARGGTELKAELVPYSREEESRAFVSAPSQTPWRTIQLANKPGDLITSYLILNLNEPNVLGDVSWFKPGKYVGIWWEMHIGAGTWGSGDMHSATTANTMRYIDFAAKYGFDGVLVEGWNTGWDGDWVKHPEQFNYTESYPDYDIDSLSVYAASKGVYIVGHHETGGNVDNYERQMADAFQLLEDHGIKAVKTGYVEHGNILSNGKYHHGQSYVEHFRNVIKLAARHKVAVVAHEPIKDTGERRTYPNMISREGARGQEFNAWSADGGNPPDHTVILPFTRCLAGPMDFTPGVFDISIPGKPDNRVNTTLAKQLALYVTMYSPMQMACDLPEHYEKYPDALQFIIDVGVDWETTRVLDAEIGEYLVVARKERGTGNWYVGAITNETGRNIELNMDFLEPDETYEAALYRDAENADFATNPEAYTVEHKVLRKGEKMRVYLAPGGGFAMGLDKVDDESASMD